MQTVGHLLKQKRKEKKLSLDQIEKTIKIKKKFLEFLEKDKFDQFSSQIYARGFLKNYAQFLGLDEEKTLAIFRRQSKEENSLSVRKNDQNWLFKITPQRLQLGVILIILIIFFGYLFKQYQSLITGPSLTIFSPQENLVVEKGTIIVSGKTDSEVKVLINNQEIYPNQKGEFSQEISLVKGINQIVISAENQKGKRKTIVREVIW